MFGIQFYPTPQSLAYKLIEKLDFSKVKCVLEPSAGKGDFIDALIKYRKEELFSYAFHKQYDNKKGNEHEFFDNKEEALAYINERFTQNFSDITSAKEYLHTLETGDYYYELATHEKADRKTVLDITCVEIDPDLCSILREKYRLVSNANFLDWCSFSRYDTILMNPPFAGGDKHLLKAISLCEESGGQICCILNAETLRNPHTTLRQLLAQKLGEYHAEIEYVENAFSNAEVKADVDVALIYLNIASKIISSDVAKGFVKGDVYEKEYKEFSETQLYKGDAISLLIEQFNLEARYGLKIIDTFNSMKQYIPMDKDESMRLINLSVKGCYDETDSNYSESNRYIRRLRQKYWELAFQTNGISSLLTDGARAKYQQEIRKFRDYDFTYTNIKQLQIELSQSLDTNIHEAIVNLYDNFTYKYSRENPQNVHLFNGWNTNQGFKINPKKVIYPLYLYTTYGGWGSWDVYRLRDFLTEVEKVFVYLDCGRTEGDSVYDIISKKFFNERYNGEDLSFKYFDVEVKKKGTVHIKWKCDDLIKKLTIIGCKAHGTLPNDYGTKRYSDLDKKHKDVVDAFEGKKNYADTIANAQLYLDTGSLRLLGVNANG